MRTHGLLALATACALHGCGGSPPAPPSAPPPAPAEPAPVRAADLASVLAPLSFLVGSWESPPAEGGARGSSSFAVVAQGHAIVRTNVSESPKGRHDDTMMIFAGANGIRAVYADNEGHAIDYAVVVNDAPKTATFTSAEGPGPRFRLTYRAQSDGSVAGTFELAPPGAPEFKPYLSWTMSKR